jgi:hypothetical protein
MANYPANLVKPIVIPYQVKASNTIRHGVPVKLDSGEIVPCTAATDEAIGISYSIQRMPFGSAHQTSDGWTAPAASTVNVALLGYGVVKARVGTSATATAGLPAVPGTLGSDDIVSGGGTNQANVMGTWLETGVDGDLVALNLGTACYSVSA